MSVADIAVAWHRGAERKWPKLVAELPQWLAEPDKLHAARVMRGGLTWAVLTFPDRVRTEMPDAPRLVEAATDAEDTKHPAGTPIGFHVVAIYNLGNALDCAGLSTATATWNTLVGWFPRVTVDRNHEFASFYWSVGYAALALDDKATYRRFAGAGPTGPLPFTAGETFGFNLQGLLRHLAAAVEQRAPIGAVLPAWNELLENFDTLDEAKSADAGVLLWMARIVYHRIGGIPLAQVAERLRDDIARLGAP